MIKIYYSDATRIKSFYDKNIGWFEIELNPKIKFPSKSLYPILSQYVKHFCDTCSIAVKFFHLFIAG